MIRFVVALPAEARPLIDRYRLRRRRASSDFPIYENEDVALIVSGVGKVAAAVATAYLNAGTGNQAHGIWLNVGIAGHGQRHVGDGALAHRITDDATQGNWYPPLVFDPPCETAGVLTVGNPEHMYRAPWIYDMEAAGYYPIACRFSTSELVHCFKVVSDNRTVTANTVSGKTAQQMIAKHIEVIEDIMSRLTALSAELPKIGPDARQLEKFLDRWRFTVTEQHKLRRLLTRWRTLCPDQHPWSDELNSVPSGAAVLSFLERQLDRLPAKPY